MKRKICMLICLVVICCTVSVSANSSFESPKPLLSEMTEQECLDFIKECGVMLPNVRENESDWGPFVKQTILLVENDPFVDFGISYTVSANLAEEIRIVVNNYYGINEQNVLAYSTVAADTATWLEDSEVYGTWDPKFKDYNCYSFSINIFDQWLDPGMYAYKEEYIPEYIFDLENMSIQRLADFVEYDLMALGHARINRDFSLMDTSNLCTYQNIICFRIGDGDYHFMKYTTEGWLHKPSGTQILKYKYTPTNNIDWSNERVIAGEFEEKSITYNGTIMFMSYNGHIWETYANNNGTHSECCDICGDTFTENCNLVYTSAGVNHHKATCADCGYTTPTQACTYSYAGNGDGTHERACTLCGNSMDLPCEMSYEYLMYNQHRAECTLCGDVIAEDCTAVATYCGNGSTNDIHSLACRDCGNAMSSATESCTLEYVFAGTVNGTNTHSRVCTECDYVKTASAACVYRLGDYCFFCGTHRDTVQTASLDGPNTKE